MSAMSRLATEVDLVAAGEIDASPELVTALVLMGYVTELDVFDAERAAALAYVECGECGFPDQAVDMCLQADGEYLCPGCDYDKIIEWRRHQRALERLGR